MLPAAVAAAAALMTVVLMPPGTDATCAGLYDGCGVGVGGVLDGMGGRPASLTQCCPTQLRSDNGDVTTLQLHDCQATAGGSTSRCGCRPDSDPTCPTELGKGPQGVKVKFGHAQVGFPQIS